MAEERAQRRLAAILSADAVGYSRLMAADETRTLRLLAERRQVLGDAIARYGGRVVDAPGDNLLAEFPSVVDAVACAVESQRELGRRDADLPGERRLPFRIGVNLGDVLVEGGRLYGGGVNVAARLEGLAEPGGVCISGAAYDQVKGKLSLGYRDLGEQRVKNIPEPVRVYRVGPDGQTLPVERRVRRRLAAALAGALTLAALVLGPWRFEALRSGPAPPTSRGRSLAVLPFVDLSPGGDQAWFSDGVHEEIIARLSRIGALRVTSRTSVMRYRDSEQGAREIGEALGVDAILEGSVRHADGRVRISAQLIDTRSEGHLWVESYDGELSQIFAVQSDVARQIAAALEVELSPEERARIQRKPTESIEAYELYLLGRYYWSKFNEGDLRSSIKYFERAIEADPAFALAHAGLGSVYTELGSGLYWLAPGDAYAGARPALERALALDPDLADAHAELGNLFAWHDWDWGAAEREFETALALDPESVIVLEHYSFFLSSRGRHEEALSAIERAVELEPISPYIREQAGNRYWAAGRFEQAIEELEMALELDPAWPGPHVTSSLCHAQLGRFEEAIAEVEGEVAIRRDPERLEALGMIYAQAGRIREAREILEELERLAQQRHVSPRSFASLHLALGEEESTLDWLERVVDERDRQAIWLSSFWFWDRLRSHPRFQELVARVEGGARH